MNVQKLWEQLKVIGPSFIVDKAHDFGGSRAGRADKPSGYKEKKDKKTGEKTLNTRSGRNFLAQFCKKLCSAFIQDFPPSDETGEIIWSEQKTIYYTAPVYALLWIAVKNHSIEPFYDSTEGISFQGYRQGACLKKKVFLKDDFFSTDSQAKTLKTNVYRNSMQNNPCKYDSRWSAEDSPLRQNKTRQLQSNIGDNNIISGIWNIPSSSTLSPNLNNSQFIQDMNVPGQGRLIDRIRDKLKAGTASYLDAATGVKVSPTHGINYNMPFLAAKNIVGGNTVYYYININVSNAKEGSEGVTYTLDFELYSNTGTAWTGPTDTNSLKLEDSNDFPADVGILGCLINTLVNRNDGGNDTPGGQQYQWDNVKTIINSMTDPIEPLKKIKNWEEIMARLIYIAKYYADVIYVGEQVNEKVAFVFAFIMQIKTMGDFSNIKDCEWFEQNKPHSRDGPCYILSEDGFLKKIVSPFKKVYRPRVISSDNLTTNKKGPILKANKTYSIKRENKIEDYHQVGGGADEETKRPFDIDYLKEELNNRHTTCLDRILCRIGQMRDINRAIKRMNMGNIWRNITRMAENGRIVEMGSMLPAEEADLNGSEKRAYLRGDKRRKNIAIGHLQSMLFGNYLSPSPSLYRGGIISLKQQQKYINIWNMSRLDPNIDIWEGGFGNEYCNSSQFYVNELDAVDRNMATLRDIYTDLVQNYPYNPSLQKRLNDWDNRFNGALSGGESNQGEEAPLAKSFESSINYLFLKAWLFRISAMEAYRNARCVCTTVSCAKCKVGVFQEGIRLGGPNIPFNVWFSDYFVSLRPASDSSNASEQEPLLQDEGALDTELASYDSPTAWRESKWDSTPQTGTQPAHGSEGLRARSPNPKSLDFNGGKKTKRRRRRRKKKTIRKNKRRKKTKRRRKRRKKTRRRR